MDFNKDYYQDNITFGNEDKEKKYSVEDVMADNVENVTVNDDEGRKNYVSMDDDVNNSPFYVCADRYVICADLFLQMRGKFTIICAFQLRGF